MDLFFYSLDFNLNIYLWARDVTGTLQKQASEENDGAVNGVWMRINLIPAAILHTLFLFFKLLQNVIIKLADFGFAKIDRGDLVTPQFTPYYVSPQVKIK